jgi:CheY-like chemotaxis protein
MSECGAILLVEDNEDDVFFMKRALRTAEVRQSLQVVMDGQSAVDYLGGVGQFADRRQYPLPCLILLDLKLPRKNGLEVLEWIRRESPVRSVVVLILSTSKENSDIEAAYRLSANAYLVKPAVVEQLTDIVRAIKAFWLTHNQFEPRA